MSDQVPIKNPYAVALGRLSGGKPRRQSPELRAKRQAQMVKARAALAQKRAEAKLAKGVQP